MRVRAGWISCNGGGDSGRFAGVAKTNATSISRRGLFVAAALGSLGWLDARRSALAQLAFKPRPEDCHTLVVIFLRGGADGLNVIVPYGEAAYYRNRPSLAIPAPQDTAAPERGRSLDLNGFFAMHPSMRAAHALFREGSLAVLHACGSFDQTRSHFDAMSAMERGLAQAEGVASSGWLARHLTTTEGNSSSPLRAVAFGGVMPDSLRGASGAISLESLKDYRMAAPDSASDQLEALYRKGRDAVAVAGRDTFAAMRSLNRLDAASYLPAGGAQYPVTDLGNGLRQVAMLVKSGVGLEVACLDKGGWDTHIAQGNSEGWQANLLKDLSDSLGAFASDLGPGLKRVTTVVMTEFGRRVYENSGLGTDHGRASIMLVLGGGVGGGKVIVDWPGLENHQLEGPGDLRVTTDYRNVLAEILLTTIGSPDVGDVFPGLSYQPVGLSS